MVDQDYIGVVRHHRWISASEQRARLEAERVKRIVDLNEHPREYLLRMVREKSTVVLAYAFLLAEPRRRASDMLRDYDAFAAKLAKLPRGCSAAVKDLDTGLTADTPGLRKAMLEVVRTQLAKHVRGQAMAKTNKSRAVVFSDAEWDKFEAIWLNVRKFPGWVECEKAFKQINPKMNRWRAHAKFGPRQKTR